MEESGERLPVIISGTVTDASGRILSGQTVSAFWHCVRHARPLAIGLNCALGAALMRPYIEELAQVAGDTFVSCYPNAGLPNPMSETGFDETPEITGAPAGGVRAARASSTSPAAAAARRPSTSRGSPSASASTGRACRASANCGRADSATLDREVPLGGTARSVRRPIMPPCRCLPP